LTRWRPLFTGFGWSFDCEACGLRGGLHWPALRVDAHGEILFKMGVASVRRAPHHSEIRTRNHQLIGRRLARIPHGPGVDKAELVSTSTARPKLGDGVVETVPDIQRILCS